MMEKFVQDIPLSIGKFHGNVPQLSGNRKGHSETEGRENGWEGLYIMRYHLVLVLVEVDENKHTRYIHIQYISLYARTEFFLAIRNLRFIHVVENNKTQSFQQEHFPRNER